MIRIVLDSNILISAFFWDGNERALVLKCKSNEVQLVTSTFILDEVEPVLTEKFEVPTGKVEQYLSDILFMSEVVFPKGNIGVVHDDPSDNFVLETALLGRSPIIVTGDKHLLKVGRYKDIRIMKTTECRGRII